MITAGSSAHVVLHVVGAYHAPIGQRFHLSGCSDWWSHFLRAGYRPEFIERVRHCEYPQFVWDRLPITSDTKESILRLDHIQPIGAHYNAFKLSDFRLSDEALGIMDELIRCLIWGGVEKGGFIAMYREGIETTFNTGK